MRVQGLPLCRRVSLICKSEADRGGAGSLPGGGLPCVTEQKLPGEDVSAGFVNYRLYSKVE